MVGLVGMIATWLFMGSSEVGRNLARDSASLPQVLANLLITSQDSSTSKYEICLSRNLN